MNKFRGSLVVMCSKTGSRRILLFEKSYSIPACESSC